MGKKCIGIDVGGTSVKIGLFETTGDLLLKWEVPTRKEEGGKYIIGDVAASILKTLEEKQIPRWSVPDWEFPDRLCRTALWKYA